MNFWIIIYRLLQAFTTAEKQKNSVYKGGVLRRLAVRMSKRSACSFPFVVFGEVGLTFKAKIRTIWENNPAGLLWCGGYIYFGRKVLYDLVYYQQVMTILENKKGKDFWSLK